MTTDAPARGGAATRPRRRLALAAALPLVAGGWLVVLAAVTAVPGAAPAALVLLPPAGLLDRLPDAAVVGRSAISVTLRSDRADFVAALYRAGAPLVLPAGLNGCVTPPLADT